MKTEIIQDDDFLTKEDQQNFINKMFGNETKEGQIPFWRMSNILAIFNSQNNKEDFPFRQTPLAFMTPETGLFLQSFGDLNLEDFKDIFDKFCKKHNIEYDKILRSRLVITGMDNQGKYHLPHVDTIIDHDVFLYYLHDVDGDTIFFDKFLNDDLSNPQIIKRVSPKMGRAIRFDGHQFHSSYTTEKMQFRCVLNVCYTTKKEKK